MKNDKKSTKQVDMKKILNKIVKFLKKLGVLLKKGIIALIEKLKAFDSTGNLIFIEYSEEIFKKDIIEDKE